MLRHVVTADCFAFFLLFSLLVSMLCGQTRHMHMQLYHKKRPSEAGARLPTWRVREETTTQEQQQQQWQ